MEAATRTVGSATLATPNDGAEAARPAEPPARDSLTEARPLLQNFQGFIDEIGSDWVSGWMWDPRQPQIRLELDLLEGDTRLARVVASQFRSDLQASGIGDGGYAFTIPLAGRLPPDRRHVLHLRLADTEIDLPGTPIVIEPVIRPSSPAEVPKPTAAPTSPASTDGKIVGEGEIAPVGGASALVRPPPFDNSAETGAALALGKAKTPSDLLPAPVVPSTDPESGLRSSVDSADWSGVRGWVWDPLHPRRRIALELLDGDTPLASTVASEYRGDLEVAGIGDGRHGFSFSFGETLFPFARHVLHLRVAGGTAELPSFPRVLLREDAGVDPTVQFVLGNIVADAERAETAEELAPVVTLLVQFLDAALSRYFALVAEADASAADFLNPAELSPQFQTLVKSIQWSYPPIHLDTAGEPLVSIVIPVFNKFDLTYACVKSVIEQGAEIPFEIVIVDDGSRDETMLAGLAFGPGIRLIRNAENSGFIRSCNRGFDAARGEYVVFLNNDTEVKARWLDELYETMQRDPEIGIVGSKLLYPDGTLQESGGIVWRLGDGWNWGRGQPADDPRYCYMRDADYVSGAAMMIKARLFAELGKFDEHYLPAYYEDTELCFRAREAGHRVVVQPASEVIHFEGASAGTNVAGTGMKRFQAINHRKFFARWKETLATHRFNGEMPELKVERGVRQRALFIDDSVPEPDKDAGSNAALQHMLSLQRLGYKVTFIPADNMARIEPYTTALQRRGIECLYHPFCPSVEDALKKRRMPFDLVYLHRYSNASKYGGLIRQLFAEARILYNVADLHFLRMQRQAEVESDPKLWDKADQLRRLELSAMSFVDCVIVHSEAEASLLREIAPEVEVRVIPWTIPLLDITKRETTDPAIAFIGGYRHPPNVDAAKWAADSIMPPLREAVPGIELLLVGSHMPAEISALAARDIVPLGYVPSLDSVFERVRLTIAPLRFGAGLKGKVLDSLAAGLPCVMTSIAAEGVELPGELQSLIADDAATLAMRIATLCHDDAEYRRVVAAGRAHVAANYSSERIDDLLRQACTAE